MSASDSRGVQPPSEFVRLVRDALRHLYDPAHLQGHPLGLRLGAQLPNAGNQAQELRVYLLDAIELLAPGGATASEKEQRPYKVLVQRYVGGLSSSEIAERMHLGPRQVRREHEKGVEALAAHLWQFCSQPTPQSGLQAELDTLGLELESLSLRDVLAAIQAPARALAHGHGVALQVTTGGEDLGMLGDRTLAKQAVLSCLSVLSGRQPRYVEVSALRERRASGVRIEVTPALRVDHAVLLEELHACQALMAAQGGHMRVLTQDDGLCAGISLFFRPESRAHVLVVDDNEKMLQLYRRYLTRGRYQMSTATSACQAQEMLAASPFDAVVLDVMMRGVDGWELLQALRADPRLQDVPVIVCSVLDEPDLALFLGARAYLRKPLVPEDLLATLQRLLDESSRVERSQGGP